MTNDEAPVIPSAPRQNATLLWGGSIAASIGLAAVPLLGSAFGLLAALGLAFLLTLVGTVYGVITLCVLWRRRKRAVAVAPELMPASRGAAQFATVPQVFTLVLEIGILVALVALGFVLFYNAIAPSPVAISDSVYENSFVDNGALLAIVPIPFLSTAALVLGAVYNYSPRLLAGEQWALANRAGAWQLIRGARIVNRIALIFFTVGGAALLISTIIGQIVALISINNYAGGY